VQVCLGLLLVWLLCLSFHVKAFVILPILVIFLFIPAKQEYPPKLWNLLVIKPIYFSFGGFYANVGGI
jgi:hypothetical protein